MNATARVLERRREIVARLELEPEERIALALERLSDLGELLVDRLELVLELLPLTGEETHETAT